MTLNQNSFFTLTEHAVTSIQKGFICNVCSEANMRGDLMGRSHPSVALMHYELANVWATHNRSA